MIGAEDVPQIVMVQALWFHCKAREFCGRLYHTLSSNNDTSDAVARQAGGLEGRPKGTRPSESIFFGSRLAAGYPLGAAKREPKEIILEGLQPSKTPAWRGAS